MTSTHRNHCDRFFRHNCFYAATLLLSATTSRAVAFTPTHRSPSPITSRSATVIQRYRIENGFSQPDHHRKSLNTSESSQQQSEDAFSLLPERISIQRLCSPAEFQTQVIDETESLVVVRFYADACPSCKATSSLFRKWSRDVVYGSDSESSESTMPIKIVEMPLTKATSSFIQDELQVEKLPYCHLYHPDCGLIEERLVMNRADLKQFCNTVDTWSRGGCDFDLEGDLAGNCQEFC